MINLTNKRFGKLTALKYAGNSKRLCKCDCGNSTIVDTCKLTSGHTKSCGCLKRQSYHHTHGLGKPKTYSHWVNMKTRCLNRNNAKYKDYGGRGIKICDEWLDFKNFHEWAINNGFKEDLTLDRIDVNGNYCPSNCRWITMFEQASNKRNTRWVTFNGITDTIKGWSKRVNMPHGTLWNRIIRNNWNVEKALTTPTKKKGGAL